MFRSDRGSAGVMFSLGDVVLLTSACGLCETVVGGTVNSDKCVLKPSLAKGRMSIISRAMGSKLVKMVRKADSGSETIDGEAGRRQTRRSWPCRRWL